MKSVKTLALDFDGVMNTYHGWKGEDVMFNPAPGLNGFLNWCKANGWEVVVFTTRDPSRVREWLEQHFLSSYIFDVTNTKPLALAYVDDRAFRFTGSFEDIITALDSMALKTHWEQEVTSEN